MSDDDRTRAFGDSDDADETRALGAEDEPTHRMASGADEFPTRRYDPATPVAAEHTEVLDIPPDPRAGRATGLAAAMVVLALVIGAIVGYATRSPHPSGVVAQGLVKPDGGLIPFDGSGRVEIPRGALSTATNVVIRRVALDQDITLRRADGTTQEFKKGTVTLYSFEPSDTRFNQPITIRLPAKGTADTALVVASDEVRVIAGEQQGNVFVITTEDFSFR
jgi:hypothetical protein